MSLLWTKQFSTVILVDHSNIESANLDTANAISEWFSIWADGASTSNGLTDILIRLYGGWFEELAFSPDRLRAIETAAKYWPELVSAENSHGRIHLEFSDHLLIRGTPRISHTLVPRNGPLRIRRTQLASNCQTARCAARAAFDWLRSNSGCTEPLCPNSFAECFKPLEQKQVDIHLAQDLSELSRGFNHTTSVVLFSEDRDFIPALISAAHNVRSPRQLFWLRSAGSTCHADSALSDLGVNILKIATRRGRHD